MLRNIRYSQLSLLRNPGLLLDATLTLALGIGANTAILSIANGVLLRAHPYPERERLTTFRSNRSYLDLLDVQSQTASRTTEG